MIGDNFAVVGNWSWDKNQTKGLSVYRYHPETAALEPVGNFLTEVTAGQQFFNPEQNVLYIVNEVRDLHGQTGGGGYVIALSMDPDSGILTFRNQKESLSPLPSYFCLDKSRKYAVVTNHGTRNYITKIIRNEEGRYQPETVFDDVAVTLFRINEDGSIGDACDISLIQGKGVTGCHMIPHPHSVVADPSGELFIVCDKGLDMIYAYHLDRDNGKLLLKDELAVKEGYAPRYSAFHPALPVVYCNNENVPVVHAVLYDAASGKLVLKSVFNVLFPIAESGNIPEGSCSDILVHPNGKHLYVSVRKANIIAVLDIDGKGDATLVQNIDCRGDNPRGLCLSPDRQYLFAANVVSSNIAGFTILDNGTLEALENETKAPCPGNIQIIAF